MERVEEFGSDFHLCLEEPYYVNNSGSEFAYGNRSFHLSGRAALSAMLLEGIRRFGWHSVYFPSYYCHDVVDFVKRLDIEVYYYYFNPFLDDDSTVIDVRDEEGAVVINVLFFGVRKANVTTFKKATIIDDVTHSLSAHEDSTAHYRFASIRKQLPVPCGGFCFPSVEKETYERSFPGAEEIAYQRMTAMTLKRKYLNGEIDDKETYLYLFKTSEEHLKDESYLGIPKVVFSMVLNMNVKAIVAARQKNIALLQSLVQRDIYFRGENSSGLFLKFKSLAERDHMKTYLIQHDIFPAVLWPSQTNERDKSIQDTMLFIHADYRYDSDDMHYIAGVLNTFNGNE